MADKERLRVVTAISLNAFGLLPGQQAEFLFETASFMWRSQRSERCQHQRRP
jgi:hypothetical protein